MLNVDDAPTGAIVNNPSSSDSPPTVSGHKVVLGMLGFAVVMVAALWLYWELYKRPFSELQQAIAAEFKDSSPQVIGGRHKSDEQNPETLRIIVRVAWDPNADEERSMRCARRLVELAWQHQHNLPNYEVLEVHLMQTVPESEPRHWLQSRPLAEWLDDTQIESVTATHSIAD
jgi:hypothetical protein